jgi:hypothetical protein
MADDARADFPRAQRADSELGEQPTDSLAMDPLVLLDLGDHRLLLGIAHRTGVALIGESGGFLAGVGELEQPNQPVPGLVLGNHRPPLPLIVSSPG